MAKYKYYANNWLFRVADGKTERYDGEGVWVKCKFDPVAAADFKSEKWDEGETSEISGNDFEEFVKYFDDRAKSKGWHK